MKIQTKNKIIAPVILMVTMVMLFSSCLKKSDAVLKPSVSIPFTGVDLVKTLAGNKTLTLFTRAFNRLSLAGSIDANKGYTIFAPSDSAMKAAGLDSAGINKLSIDSLYKLIAYQIAIGFIDDKALTNSVITTQVVTLKQDTVRDMYGYTTINLPPLFVKESGVLYLNGVPVTKTAPVIQASNGYIYPVNGLITHIPSRTLYDIIKSDPDLSLYNQALIIADSLRDAGIGYPDQNSEDVTTFSNPIVYYDPAIPTSTNYASFFPTLLAPTNKAFNDAGFYTVNDIRKFALRSPVGYDATYSFFNYSPVDSVLKHHVIYNANVAFGNPSTNIIGITRVFYNDLLNPAINNGIYNSYLGPGTNVLQGQFLLTFTVPLVFSNSNGIVYVKWNNNPASAAVILPHDASPQHPVNNYIASNGALYKIDKLFYPIVQ